MSKGGAPDNFIINLPHDLLSVFDLQGFQEVGLVKEFRRVTSNGVIDQVVTQRFERYVLFSRRSVHKTRYWYG